MFFLCGAATGAVAAVILQIKDDNYDLYLTVSIQDELMLRSKIQE